MREIYSQGLLVPQHAFGQGQAGRIVLDHRGQVPVDQTGHAGTIAGVRQLRPGAGGE